MSGLSPGDVQLALALIEIATKAAAAVKQLRADKPEVYAAIGKHHADALASLAEANKAP